MFIFADNSFIAQTLEHTIEYRDKCVEIKNRISAFIDKAVSDFNKSYKSKYQVFTFYKTINFPITGLDIEVPITPIFDTLFIQTKLNYPSVIDKLHIFYHHSYTQEFITIANYFEADSKRFIVNERTFTIQEFENRFIAWLNSYAFSSFTKENTSKPQFILDFINSIPKDGFQVDTLYSIKYFDGEDLEFYVTCEESNISFEFEDKQYYLGGVFNSLYFIEEDKVLSPHNKCLTLDNRYLIKNIKKV